ncbi:MAG: hypothetical protein QOC92_4164 [Acidimicrobiaceae bacterium]|jgi:hypothetical protein
MTTSTSEPEGLDGYVPPPYQPPATLDERLAKAWQEITRTPGRAALATFDISALVALLVSLRTIPVTTTDSAGDLRANCGVSLYFGKASNRAVDTACRYAYSSRVPLLFLLALVVLVTTALLIRTIAKPGRDEARLRRWWRDVTATPARAAMATFDAAALLAVIAAAQPVDLATADASGPLRVHCGLRYFIIGTDNAAVQDACRRTYGTRAALVLLMLVVLVVGVLGLVTLLRRPVAEAASASPDQS